MTHRFPIKEIARHAGIGTATVDRVINGRAHVSPQTKLRVARAIADMERQEGQIATQGRQMFFDFVIEAPKRFSREVKAAAENVMREIGTAACRSRFTLQEIMSTDEVVQILNRITKRGSQGVCIKVRDVSEIRTAVDRVVAAGIPVVTLVTDVQGTHRTSYVGLDNTGAGRTAAYLVGQIVGDMPGCVLATRSNARFLGEEERASAFSDALMQTCPHLRIVSANAGGGVHFETTKDLEGVIGWLDDLVAVYSMGGGNQTILNVLETHRLKPKVYVAHDLDRDNRALIETGQINFILHHDLRKDLRGVFAAFFRHQDMRIEVEEPRVSSVMVITPENIPVTS
jgi:LacI family transcriptional regulator